MCTVNPEDVAFDLSLIDNAPVMGDDDKTMIVIKAGVRINGTVTLVYSFGLS
jgi:hypothetical protein